MEKLTKSKVATAFMVMATLILAGIAVFTAVRLYQLRQEPVAPNVPESEPLAFDCSYYDLIVDVDGTVRIKNVSGDERPEQNIEFFIDGVSIGNFNVPALTEEEVAILGDLNLPEGDYDWSIDGVEGCAEQGEPQLTSCQEVAFTISDSEGELTPTPTDTQQQAPTITPTPTPSPTSTPTNSPTPTDRPVGGSEPTNTPTPTTQPTTTPTDGVSTQATSTPAQIADAGTTTPTQETLPDAGISTPTLYISLLSLVVIFLSLALAL